MARAELAPEAITWDGSTATIALRAVELGDVAGHLGPGTTIAGARAVWYPTGSVHFTPGFAAPVVGSGGVATADGTAATPALTLRD